MSENKNSNFNNIKKSDFSKDDAYKNLERVNNWISNVDNKISFALAFISALIGVFFTSNNIKDCINIITDINSKHKSIIISIISFIFAIMILLFALRSIWYLLKGLTAKFDIKKYKDKGIILDSNLFWGVIANKNFIEFNNKLEKLTETALLKDINSQTYINSVICNDKFTNYNAGLLNIKITVVFFIIFQLMGYIK